MIRFSGAALFALAIAIPALPAAAQTGSQQPYYRSAPQGGPGASPNRYYRWEGERYAFEPRGDYWYNDRFGYYSPDYGWYDQDRRCWREPRWNPPGPRGGPGWGWETPAGIRRC